MNPYKTRTALVIGSVIAVVVLALGGQPSLASSPHASRALQVSVSQIVASGFTQPIQVTHAGDSSNRLFVVERTGKIKIIKNGSVLSTAFLDVSSLINASGSEQGLLGLTFHPNYRTNGYFYIDYTNTAGDTVIARYSVSGNPDVANSGSALPLLTIDQPAANHNGGQLLFSPIDGYLYIGMGDGGGGDDTYNNGQSKNSLLGKMLRIDVNGATPYAIPPSNPFAGVVAGADEIWAMGMRNPWRFSFDRANGDLYIGDVGQDAWEEVDYQAAGTPGGRNYGWPCREGAHTNRTDPPCDDPGLLAGLTNPIAEYANSGSQIAVTGGFVYRGSDYPALVGRYFYADYGSGRMWSLFKTGPNTWSTPEIVLESGFSISSFGEDERGELYVVEYGGGRIRRLTDAGSPGSTPTPTRTPTATPAPNLTSSQKTASTSNADPGEVVIYTIRLINTGQPSSATLFLTDTIPSGLQYVPNSLEATQGTVNDSFDPILRWQGALIPAQNITITYQVTANGNPGSFVNRANLTGAAIQPITLSAAIYVPRPVLTTTQTDFFLPGTQPGQLSATIPNPVDCDTCHTAPIYDRWRGSMMSQAGRDPLMWSALSIANNTAPNAGDFCLRCHTPKGWLEGRSHPASGTALQPVDIQAGVACEVCHRMVDPDPSSGGEASTIDQSIRATLALSSTLPNAAHMGSAMMIVDPNDNRRGPFSFGGNTVNHTAYKTGFLGQSTNAIAESRLCGTCHNLDNPTLSWDAVNQEYRPNGSDLAAPSFGKGDLFPIERTFDEWLNSAYPAGVYAPQFAGSKPNGIVASCQDCHMRRTVGKAAEDAFNPVNRDCGPTAGCLPEHDLVGGNTWVPQILRDTRWRLNGAAESAYLNATTLRAREMLQKAATITVSVDLSGAQPVATVRVINETGHKLPTGYPEGRRMWLNVKAYNHNGILVQEWGAYNPATASLTTSNTKVYEAKQGLTSSAAAALNLPAGESFFFVLNNTTLKDNRIPPRGFTQAALNQRGMQPVQATYTPGQYWDDTVYVLPSTATRVMVTLYYQTASKEYIDFLRAYGGLDGTALGALWDSSKSAPEVVGRAWFPSYPAYLPIIHRSP